MSYLVPAQDNDGWYLYIQLERNSNQEFVREGWEPTEQHEWDYIRGVSKPNYQLPAIRECPWCKSKHLGHCHFVCDDGLIVPLMVAL